MAAPVVKSGCMGGVWKGILFFCPSDGQEGTMAAASQISVMGRSRQGVFRALGPLFATAQSYINYSNQTLPGKGKGGGHFYPPPHTFILPVSKYPFSFVWSMPKPHLASCRICRIHQGVCRTSSGNNAASEIK